MPEMIYIHIKIHQNGLYLRQSFFYFLSHKRNTPGEYDCNTTQLTTYHVRSN